MENGYSILWTENALIELENTYKYLEDNFTEKALRNLSKELDKVLY